MVLLRVGNSEELVSLFPPPSLPAGAGYLWPACAGVWTGGGAAVGDGMGGCGLIPCTGLGWRWGFVSVVPSRATGIDETVGYGFVNIGAGCGTWGYRP